MELGLDERNALIEEHLALRALVVNLILGKVIRPRAELRQELASQASLLLVEAASKFDPERGVPFYLFAKRWMLWRLMECIRRKAHRDNSHGPLPTVMPAVVEDDGPDVELARRAMANMPVLHYAFLVRRYAGGRTVEQIAEEFGVTRGVVEKGMRAARTGLRLEIERLQLRRPEEPHGRRSAA